MWAGAISELTEQVHLEDPSLIDGAEAPEPVSHTFFQPVVNMQWIDVVGILRSTDQRALCKRSSTWHVYTSNIFKYSKAWKHATIALYTHKNERMC